MFLQKPKLLTALFALVFPIFLFSQLTIRVTSIPANTPPGDKIYIAGTFNNWNEKDPNAILKSIGGGIYEVKINPPAGNLQYKFTRGTWQTVEGNASGGFQANHTYNYSGSATTFQTAILSWEGQGGSGGNGVSILSNDFYIPQLNRTRRIWIYLPPDYASTTKKYPVLYLQDGQNLFDENAPFGEWEVDESLNKLHAAGDYGCIVVGIDHGGVDRLNEYSPWVNSSYGGGQGEQYAKFIVETLKPHIDANFRTLSGRLTTGIGGSSMGALIAHYALLERQDVYSKAAIFSPAFWFGGNGSVNHSYANPKMEDIRVYFLAGGDEPQSVTTDAKAVENAMLNSGFWPHDINFKTPSDGAHSEWFWAREFPEAYVWLFKNTVTATKSAAAPPDEIGIFPNPAADILRLNNTSNLHYKILNVNGLVVSDSTIAPGQSISVSELPNGFYYLNFEENGKSVGVRKFSVVR